MFPMGILSPQTLLLTVYMKDLLIQSSQSGYGYSVGKCCVGATTYADDTSIMVTSVSGLQSFLDICLSFAKSCDMINLAIKKQNAYHL